IANRHPNAKLPEVFFVNWFRRDEEGRLCWPGFGENSRVLAWIVDRIEGRADARETPIGYVPTPDALDLTGLNPEQVDLKAALHVDAEEWRAELPLIRQWFESLGETVPAQLWDELAALEQRLAEY